MYQIDIQLATTEPTIPPATLLQTWATAALQNQCETAEVVIRIVGLAEMTHLNETYRHKKGPTNVLSFPCDEPDEFNFGVPLLGDIVICASVVETEALAQGTSSAAHWAHMVVHGILHLLGYDHQQDAEAEVMENLEITILERIGFSNPYQTRGRIKDE